MSVQYEARNEAETVVGGACRRHLPRRSTGAGELHYDAVANLLKLPPDVGTLGEVVGVARDSKGNFYIYTRAAHQRLFEFDKTGKYMREIGKDMYAADFAHTVRVDKEDNIWAVDEGSNMIVKFNQAGEVIMTLGRKWEIPDGRPEEPARGAPPPVARGSNFKRQTDVAWFNVPHTISLARDRRATRPAAFDINQGRAHIQAKRPARSPARLPSQRGPQ